MATVPEPTTFRDDATPRPVGIEPPHEAQIIETDLPHIKFAVAVTERHGQQINQIAVPEDQVSPYPMRAKGDRRVADLPSFLAELKRRKLLDGVSTLWGNGDRGQIIAVYNDHDSLADTDGHAGWRDDLLTLTLAADPDWKAWHALSGKFMPQNTFGDTIEELLHTIVDPDQADLLEIIDSVRASTSGEFEQSIDRSNGGQKLVYKTEHQVKAGRTGQLEVPQFITLGLVPWENHPTIYNVEAYFRVKIHEGNLSLAVKLKPTRQFLRAAWTEVTNAVTDQTGVPVYAVS